MYRLLIVMILLSLSTLLSGCMTSTRFTTKPEGAKLYINGDYMGVTPIIFNDKRGLPTRLHIKVKKEGYKELNFYLDKSPDYLGTLSLLIPYTLFASPWINASLDDKYAFNLRSLRLPKDERTNEDISSKEPEVAQENETIEIVP